MLILAPVFFHDLADHLCRRLPITSRILSVGDGEHLDGAAHARRARRARLRQRLGHLAEDVDAAVLGLG